MNFFQEFERLKEKMPRIGSIRINAINSEYTHNTDQCKNCYLIANAVKNEDCMYGRDFYENANCVDCDHVLQCTLCYECLNCKTCWDSTYLQDCANCQNCDFGYYLKDCQNCMGCVGLCKKQFHIFNKPYSKEEFEQKKKSLRQKEIKKEFEQLQLKVPRVWSLQIATENCIGDYIQNSQNAFWSFDVVECQDVGYVQEVKRLKDCWDISFLEESELCYECSSNHILNNCNFCFMCLNCSDLEYCEYIMNSKYCFGCVSLNHKDYHILNQPYSREEYFKKVAEIKNQLKKEGSYGRYYLKPGYPFEDTVASWPKL